MCSGRAAPKAFGVGREFNSPPWHDYLMAWVYILRGSAGRYYIGSTVDFDARLAQHLRGHTATTKRLGDKLEVIAKKQVVTLGEARRIEPRLKSSNNGLPH